MQPRKHNLTMTIPWDLLPQINYCVQFVCQMQTSNPPPPRSCGGKDQSEPRVLCIKAQPCNVLGHVTAGGKGIPRVVGTSRCVASPSTLARHLGGGVSTHTLDPTTQHLPTHLYWWVVDRGCGGGGFKKMSLSLQLRRREIKSNRRPLGWKSSVVSWPLPPRTSD